MSASLLHTIALSLSLLLIAGSPSRTKAPVVLTPAEEARVLLVAPRPEYPIQARRAQRLREWLVPDDCQQGRLCHRSACYQEHRQQDPRCGRDSGPFKVAFQDWDWYRAR